MCEASLAPKKHSAAVFLHGEAGDGLATQIWCCYQNVHKPLVLQSLLALFVEKMMFVLFKKGFNPLVTKKISESFHIWYSRHVSMHSDVVSWHSWKHYGPTTSTRPCNCKSHHLNSIEPFKGKIMAKKIMKIPGPEANLRDKTNATPQKKNSLTAQLVSKTMVQIQKITYL